MGARYLLYLCLNYFNEIQFVARWLASVRSAIHVPYKIVAVDGAYRAFPHNTAQSSDGSEKIMQGAADVHILPPLCIPWPDEVIKRNAYLIGREGDTYLTLDADEMLEGSVDSLPKGDHDIMLHRVDVSLPYPVFRYFWHRPGLYYGGAHSILWSHGDILNLHERPLFPGLLIKHVTGERTLERITRKGAYYKVMTEQEKQVRKDFGR